MLPRRIATSVGAIMTSTATGSNRSSSLLQRRHDQLCLEVERVALRLFAQRGYHDVTVDEIAAASGISARTFFRHFATKEEVLVGELRRRIDRAAAYIATRPSDEPAVVTVRRAILSEIGKGDAEGIGDWARIVWSDPVLYARVSGIAAAQRSVITELLATRMGVDASTDVRPGVIAASMLAAAEHAYRIWLQGDRDSSLRSVTEQALNLVEQGIGSTPGF
jgi:AcrR family transcriptional regulator